MPDMIDPRFSIAEALAFDDVLVRPRL